MGPVRRKVTPWMVQTPAAAPSPHGFCWRSQAGQKLFSSEASQSPALAGERDFCAGEKKFLRFRYCSLFRFEGGHTNPRAFSKLHGKLRRERAPAPRAGQAAAGAGRRVPFQISRQRYESGFPSIPGLGGTIPLSLSFCPEKCYFGSEKPAWSFLVEGVPSEVPLVLCPSPPAPAAARRARAAPLALQIHPHAMLGFITNYFLLITVNVSAWMLP